MAASAFLLGLALFAASDAPVLLRVTDGNGPCTPIDASVDAGAFRSHESSAEAVAEDLRRYFAGLSAQFTPVLPAAWHGKVHYCSDAAEDRVIQSLIECTIRQTDHDSRAETSLPGGAEELLVALSSQRLLQQLEALEPLTTAEADRQAAAIALVRGAVSSP